MEIKKVKSRQPIPQNAKRVFKGVIFDVYQWEQEMYDGSKATFERLKRPDSAMVFPILPDGRIILASQEQPDKDLFLGLIGGRVEVGEDAITAAKRELLEETGYTANEFILWSKSSPVGKVDSTFYTFIAKGIKKVANQNLDAGEKIDLKLFTFDEFLNLANDEDFVEREKEVVLKILQAKLYPEKMVELKKLFSPK